MVEVFQALVTFFQITFGFLPEPLYWLMGALVGISQMFIMGKIIAFILDQIPFL